MAAEKLTVLEFISGKYSGQEYPVEGEPFIAGRSTEANLVLADDAVSRKHARFFARRGRVWVRDLGSRNGTVINGERVELHCLRAGDRLAIGSSLVKISTKARNRISKRRAGEARRRGPNDSAGRSMTGSIEDIPLMDVLQWLATSRKTGALRVRDPEGQRHGALHLREGQVFFANIDGNDALHPEKALFRMLHWQKGMFELESKVEENPPETLQMSLEHMLMEAARQQDELAALAAKTQVPAPESDVELVRPSPVRWKDLEPPELDMIQDLVEAGSWQRLMDSSKTDDLTLYKGIAVLHKRGLVRY